LTVYSSPSRPVCFNRSHSWGFLLVERSTAERFEPPTQAPEGPQRPANTRSFPLGHWLPGEPASRPSPASRESRIATDAAGWDLIDGCSPLPGSLSPLTKARGFSTWLDRSSQTMSWRSQPSCHGEQDGMRSIWTMRSAVVPTARVASYETASAPHRGATSRSPVKALPRDSARPARASNSRVRRPRSAVRAQARLPRFLPPQGRETRR
jgi:hypothetical protein